MRKSRRDLMDQGPSVNDGAWPEADVQRVIARPLALVRPESTCLATRLIRISKQPESHKTYALVLKDLSMQMPSA